MKKLDTWPNVEAETCKASWWGEARQN
jgi:hypothetical protein